jgi:predicted nucleotidyltransferase
VPERSAALFTPEQRQEYLDRLLAALEADDRLAGVLIVGSGATGFDDEYSDLDLVVVVADGHDPETVWQEWRDPIARLLPVVRCGDVRYGPGSYLWVVLLEGLLELDVGFVCFATLAARRARWKVAFDRSGRIEEAMRRSWQERPVPDVRAAHLRAVDSIWHYLLRAVAGVKRGQPWAAVHELEQVRSAAIRLGALRLGLENKHCREVHEMPPDFLADLEQTLPRTTDAPELLRAICAASTCFFRQARELLEPEAVSEMEERMEGYLGAVG